MRYRFVQGVFSLSDKSSYWPKAIEKSLAKSGARSYAQLARKLGISAQKLADARKDRQELPSETKALILGLLDEPVSQELYASVFPNKLQEEVSEYLDDIYAPERVEPVKVDFWIRRLDNLKESLRDGPADPVVPDSVIAANLGISQSMISAARRGTGVLSPAAKLKILDRLGYMASRDILCDLLPPKAGARLREFEKLRFVAKGEKRLKAEGEESD